MESIGVTPIPWLPKEDPGKFSEFADKVTYRAKADCCIRMRDSFQALTKIMSTLDCFKDTLKDILSISFLFFSISWESFYAGCCMPDNLWNSDSGQRFLSRRKRSSNFVFGLINLAVCCSTYEWLVVILAKGLSVTNGYQPCLTIKPAL